MTNVPFDLDMLMHNNAIVHATSEKAVCELAEILHNPSWGGTNMYEVWEIYREEVCYRFRNGEWVNFGDRECYQSYMYSEYFYMEYTGGAESLPDVEDLI